MTENRKKKNKEGRKQEREKGKGKKSKTQNGNIEDRKNMKAERELDIISCISKDKLCYIQCYKWKESQIMEVIVRIKDVVVFLF